MSKASQNNRSNQLNPNNPAYVKSRGDNLTQNDVSHIQSAETGSGKVQSPKGPGADAQRELSKQGQ